MKKITPTRIGERRILCPISSGGSLPLCDGFSRYGNNPGAVTVRANWRVTFRFVQGNAYDVDLEDYH